MVPFEKAASCLKDEKLSKKQTYTKTEAYKSRVFGIFMPNFIKIDHDNFELYRFKVCAFLRHSVDLSAAFDTVHHNILLRRIQHA